MPNGLIKTLGNWLSEFISIFSHASSDPITLDLDGGGIHLTSINDSSAQFDLHNTGFAVDTGWIGSGDGFLVQDHNSNGQIDNITEMFGNSSVDGFTALSALDSNHDGKITSADTDWSTLQVWVDADGDGHTDAGELHTLGDLSITEIDLATTPQSVAVNGNILGDIATFKYANNTTGMVAEAYFDNSQMDSTYTGEWTLNEEVLQLPSARGYGTVPDLFIAMSLDGDLLDMVKDLATADLADAATFDAQALAILYKWAGVEETSSTSRGSFIDGQHLAALEAFMGQSFVSTWGGTASANPQNSHQGSELEGAFNTLLSAIETRLLVQGPMASLLPGLSYNYSTDEIVGTTDFSAAMTAAGAATPSTSNEAAANYWGTLVPMLMSIADTLGVTRPTYDAALQTAFEDANLADAAAAILNSGVTIGDNTARSYTAADTEAHYIISGAGNDFLRGNTGNDVIVGGNGNDNLQGGEGTNVIYAGAGFDSILVQGVGDKVFAGEGNDTIILDTANYSNFGAAVIDGGAGTDMLWVKGDITGLTLSSIEALTIKGDVTLTAAQLADVTAVTAFSALTYETGIATITAASAGTYDLSAMALTGRVDLNGSTGADTLIAGTTTHVIFGDAGNDTISAGSATGNLVLIGGTGTNTITGGVGDDIITIQGISDHVDGGSGNDTIIIDTANYSSFGATVIDGGAGTDLLYVQGDVSAMTITGIEALNIKGDATMTAAAVSGINSITAFSSLTYETGTASINAADAGTYDLSGKTLTGRIDINGSSGADTLIGGTTTRFMWGGDGDDTISAGAAVGNLTLRGGTGTNTLTGGDANDTISVQGLNDQVSAGSGNDIIIIESSIFGAASINGGAGTDTLVAHGDISGITLSGVETLQLTDIVLTSAQLAGFTTINSLADGNAYIGAAGAGTYDLSAKTLTPLARINFYGSDGNDTFIANTERTFVYGGSGNDTLVFSSVINHTLDGGDGTDKADFSLLSIDMSVNLTNTNATVNGNTIAALKAVASTGFNNLYSIENITTGSGNDVLVSGSDNNALNGGAGADVLRGGAGNDLLDGGLGADTADYASSTSGITVNLSSSTQTLEGATIASGYAFDGFGGTDSLVSIERITGSAYDDYIYAGNDTLSIDGGAGNDTVNLFYTTNTVSLTNVETVISNTSGDDSLTLTAAITSGTIDLGAGNDTLTLGNFANSLTVVNVETINGGTSSDVVTLGSAANGTIDLAAGTDTINLGNFANNLTALNIETITGNASADAVTLGSSMTGSIDLGGGSDTLILADFANSLTVANIEAVLGGSSTDIITLATQITSGTIDLGAGSDTLVLGNFGNTVTLAHVESLLGGTVNDVITLSAAITSGTVDLGSGSDTLTLGNFANSLTVSNVETINSGSGSDTFTLASAASGLVINGNAGDDKVVLGNFTNSLNIDYVETIVGGSQNDSVTVNHGYDMVNFDGGANTDTIYVTGSAVNMTLANVENVSFSGNGSISGADTVYLSTASVGGAFDLGAGEDTLYLGNFNNTITATNIELVYGGTGDDTITITGINIAAANGGAGTDGITLANIANSGIFSNFEVITGNSAADWIFVNAAMNGSIDLKAGNDQLTLGNFTNTLTANNIESIIGGTSSDTIYLNNTSEVNSGGGNDILYSGTGANLVTLGAGNDTLIFTNVNQGGDTVTDFDANAADILKFSGLLHGTFAFIGTTAFHAAGNSEAKFNATTHILTVDTDGNGTSDMQITLNNVTLASLANADFIWT